MSNPSTMTTHSAETASKNFPSWISFENTTINITARLVGDYFYLDLYFLSL